MHCLHLYTSAALHRKIDQLGNITKPRQVFSTLCQLIFFFGCVSSQVSEVRRSTRMEKKKLAMAMREKQLGALGMQVLVFSLLYDIHCFLVQWENCLVHPKGCYD